MSTINRPGSTYNNDMNNQHKYEHNDGDDGNYIDSKMNMIHNEMMDITYNCIEKYWFINF